MNSSMKGKKVLVVYAHPEPKSMTGSLKNSIVASLQQAGAQVQVSDLYAMRFNPVVRPSDFPNRDNLNFFDTIVEQRSSVQQGEQAQDVKEETDKVIAAEFIITVSPIWWGSVPAILKGWFDRVLIPGVAWDHGKVFQGGLCAGKKGLNVFCVGSPEQAYSKAGPQGQEIADRLHHITYATFGFCGYDVIEYKHYHGIAQKTDDERKEFLKDIEIYVRTLDTQPLMHKLSA